MEFLYGKIPPSCWRSFVNYLLFKQIGRSVWSWLQRPLNFTPLQMFESPNEGIGALLRNKQLLGQSSLLDPRVDRQQRYRIPLLIG